MSLFLLRRNIIIPPSLRVFCVLRRNYRLGRTLLTDKQSKSNPKSGFQYGNHRRVQTEQEKILNQADDSLTKSKARVLFSYIWPRGKGKGYIKARVLVAVGLLFGSKLLNIQVPFLFKHAIDTINNPDPIVVVPVGLLLAYGAARAGASLMNEMRNAVFATVSQDAIRSLAVRTFEHLHRLDLNFHTGRQSGALTRALDRGSRGIAFVLAAMVFNIAPTLLEVTLVSSVLGYKFGISYALLSTSTIALYATFTLLITQWRTKFRKRMNKAENEAGNRTLDSLINFETVKYFNNEHHEAKFYDHYMKQYNDAALKTQTSLALLNVGQQAIFSVALTASMIMAAYGYRDGSMTLGDIVMINGLLFQLSFPLNFLGSVYRDIRQALVDMSSMFNLLDFNSAIQSKPGAGALKVTDGAVEFRNVVFSYAPEKPPVLNGVSFAVPGGSTVALVGPSGSGKSTIQRLLFRFFDPREGGEIRIDGQRIDEVSLESLRKAIGVVPQDTVLFNDTIFYNIHYGNLDASAEEVYEAARKARIHDSILQMPDGYDTLVGERGLKMSGGEKQRLSIARLMLKNPDIAFFDEATSALDSHTEGDIMQSLRQLNCKTQFRIAHRLSTVTDATIIFVLGSNGTIVEQGTHDELLRQGKVYYEMWIRQQEERVIDVVSEESEREAKDDRQEQGDESFKSV